MRHVVEQKVRIGRKLWSYSHDRYERFRRIFLASLTIMNARMKLKWFVTFLWFSSFAIAKHRKQSAQCTGWNESFYAKSSTNSRVSPIQSPKIKKAEKNIVRNAAFNTSHQCSYIIFCVVIYLTFEFKRFDSVS